MKVRLFASAAAVAATLALAPAASAWAPASSAPIHPGVQVFTDGAQCTANFVYQDASNTYLGQAAHCSGTGGSTETNGCDSGSLPEGTPVDISGDDGTTYHGVMVYNSWIRMQAAHETDAETCQYNDLALIRLDPADVAKVNPSVPGWGGPTGVGSEGDTGADTYSYGNSELRGGVTFLSPKQGKVVERSPGGWSTDVYTVTPGIPGDSGSGFLNDTGKAAGVLSTVAIAPLAGSNGVGDLPRELSWASAHGVSVSVVNGTEPFQTSLAAAIGSQLGL
jgi:hypothetical protein